MKRRDEYEKRCIGSSDIASLIIRAFDTEKGLFVQTLNYDGDGTYYAYLVDGECEIPEFYELMAETNGWMEIFDDEHRTFGTPGHVKVYRARGFGTIIQRVND